MPEKQAFEELLGQILLTEKLGFDEAWFAEHHHSDYGMLASPNLIIATLAPRTQRLRMGNLVNVLPLSRSDAPRRGMRHVGYSHERTAERRHSAGACRAMISSTGSTATPPKRASKKALKY